MLVLTRHGFVLSLSVSRSGSEMFGYRPKRFGFSTLWIVDVAHGATRSTAPGSVLVLVLLCLAVLFVSLELLSSFFRASSEFLPSFYSSFASSFAVFASNPVVGAEVSIRKNRLCLCSSRNAQNPPCEEMQASKSNQEPMSRLNNEGFQ